MSPMININGLNLNSLSTSINSKGDQDKVNVGDLYSREIIVKLPMLFPSVNKFVVRSINKKLEIKACPITAGMAGIQEGPEMTIKLDEIMAITGYSSTMDLEALSTYKFTGPFVVKSIDVWATIVEKNGKEYDMRNEDITPWFKFDTNLSQGREECLSREECPICYRKLEKIRTAWICEQHGCQMGC